MGNSRSDGSPRIRRAPESSRPEGGAAAVASPVPVSETNDKPRPSIPQIVGVGASAGGLEAFTELLSHLPDDTGMAFVLIQHLDPRHESHLADLLAKATAMPVAE